MHDYSCVSSCPPHHVPISGVCQGKLEFNPIVCNDRCQECDGLARSSCTACKDGEMLVNGECLSECPLGYYLDAGNCRPCPSACAGCSSAANCTECLPPYFRVGGTCVESEDCPADAYADPSSRSCKSCSSACLGCSGPTASDCRECNFPQGFARNHAAAGDCLLIHCADGTYLEIDKALRLFQCHRCDESCKLCNATDYCLECAKGHIKLDKASGLCTTCPKGYVAGHNGACEGKFNANRQKCAATD